MADWLSFWNKPTRQTNAGLQGEPLGSIFVPHAAGLIGHGDRIFIVAIERGELLLISSLIVGATSPSSWGIKQIDIETQPGADSRVDFHRKVDRDTVERLEYADRQGRRHPLPRDATGRVLGNAFQGAASIRELTDGGDRLADKLP